MEPEIGRIATFYGGMEADPSNEEPMMWLYSNALDLAEVVNSDKPAAWLWHKTGEGAAKVDHFINKLKGLYNYSHMKEILVSKDSDRLVDLKRLTFDRPNGPRNHSAIGYLLGYPNTVSAAFSDPMYNIIHVTSDGYFANKKFDEALFFAGHQWASVDDEASLEMGRRRAKLFVEMFGQGAYDKHVNTYRKHLIDLNPILEDYIPARPGYVKPDVWV